MELFFPMENSSMLSDGSFRLCIFITITDILYFQDLEDLAKQTNF